jgi:Winged helix DNA-binding domain
VAARPATLDAVTTSRLALSRSQILAFRRRVGALDERLPSGAASLRRAAWAGLQDSMPRAALISIHARVEETEPSTWEDPSLVQVWGPRWSAFVVAAADRAVFTLGRMPVDPEYRVFAEGLADQLEAFLDGRRLSYGEAGEGLGMNPNRLRYATVTGRVVLRWDGARRPTIWTVPAPEMDPADARLELARRYLHVFGPASAAAFAEWAGVGPADGRRAFEALADELAPVRTPVGHAWILAADEPAFRAHDGRPAAARILPSGDTWFLLQGRDRELLVPDAARRGGLWTSRVWPGAVLVAGEVVGTWRRAQARLSISPWRTLSAPERAAVEAEAASLPLPGIDGEIVVRWDG